MWATSCYSLTNNANGAFKIDPVTGVIKVNDPAKLDFETTPTLAIQVQVTDRFGFSLPTPKTFTINLTNVNEAPTNATLTGGSVAENSANGTTVGTVTGTDPDAGAVLTYSLFDDAGGRFAINANTGVISPTAARTCFPVVLRTDGIGVLRLPRLSVVGVKGCKSIAPTS